MPFTSSRLWAAMVAVTGALLANTVNAAEQRIALVIGNAAYAGIQSLQNPLNDAAEVEKALRGLGLRVLLLRDGRKVDIDAAIRQFSTLVRGADVGLFYYSGHGFQTSRADQHHPVNHLVPVDFHLPTGPTLENTVPLDDILRPLETARVSLVFMDACRSDPSLAQASRRFGDQARSVALGRGFAPVVVSRDAGRGVIGSAVNDGRPSGMLIAYAAAPGNEASDGDGRVSPFTKALLQHIQSPGVAITEIMGRVGSEVQRDTGFRQHPWYVSGLTAAFFLVPQAKRPTGPLILP
jgi:uncharacterized caspase-like protein